MKIFFFIIGVKFDSRLSSTVPRALGTTQTPAFSLKIVLPRIAFSFKFQTFFSPPSIYNSIKL